VSNEVVPPHVARTAVPEIAGVHSYTRSGAAPVSEHVPAKSLVPLVVPVKLPPSAGTWIGSQDAGDGVVVAVAVGTGVEVCVVVGSGVVVRVGGIAVSVGVGVWVSVAVSVGVGV
jgi:hypothetical protein